MLDNLESILKNKGLKLHLRIYKNGWDIAQCIHRCISRYQLAQGTYHQFDNMSVMLQYFQDFPLNLIPGSTLCYLIEDQELIEYRDQVIPEWSYTWREYPSVNDGNPIRTFNTWNEMESYYENNPIFYGLFESELYTYVYNGMTYQLYYFDRTQNDWGNGSVNTAPYYYYTPNVYGTYLDVQSWLDTEPSLTTYNCIIYLEETNRLYELISMTETSTYTTSIPDSTPDSITTFSSDPLPADYNPPFETFGWAPYFDAQIPSSILIMASVDILRRLSPA
ncbi:MAG: hypothetical protein EZS28_048153, partial [Streblomastix strix]